MSLIVPMGSSKKSSIDLPKSFMAFSRSRIVKSTSSIPGRGRLNQGSSAKIRMFTQSFHQSPVFGASHSSNIGMSIGMRSFIACFGSSIASVIVPLILL